MTELSQVPRSIGNEQPELLARLADLVPAAFPDGVLDTRIRFARRHFAVAPAARVDYYFTTAGAGLRVDEEWTDSRD